jgi:hypothetical protein
MTDRGPDYFRELQSKTPKWLANIAPGCSGWRSVGSRICNDTDLRRMKWTRAWSSPTDKMGLTSCGHWSADSVRENNTGENIKRIFKAAKQNTRERDGGTSPCHHSASRW